jgi:hypothetical protein
MKLVQKHITVNKFSRPGKPLKEFKGVVLHWTAKPMGAAADVFAWFEGRAKGGPQYKGLEYGSAHYTIDFDGTIWEMIPPDEMAYHCGADAYSDDAKKYLSNYPNDCTLAIEHCTTSWAGEYTPKTVAASKILVSILGSKKRGTAPILSTHNLIVRGGWDCPRDKYGVLQSFSGWQTIRTAAYGIVKNYFDNGSGKIIEPGQVQILDLDFSDNTVKIAGNYQDGALWVPAAVVDFVGVTE